MKKMNLTREQAQRFCDPIIEFLQRNPELVKKIGRKIEEIQRKNNNTQGFEKKINNFIYLCGRSNLIRVVNIHKLQYNERNGRSQTLRD
ncbi:hypothetical protein AAHB47_31100 [Bacillus wiedmannii]